MTPGERFGTWMAIGCGISLTASLLTVAVTHESLAWRFAAVAALCGFWSVMAFAGSKR